MFKIALFLTVGIMNPFLAKASVEVPVPEKLRQQGTLIVAGRPGAGQKDGFQILRCETDSQGEIVKFGCRKHREGKLNQRVALSVGTYVVEYSVTQSNPVRITNRQDSYLSLGKLTVPKVDGSYQFKVFVDFTDINEQYKLLRRHWQDAEQGDAVKKHCDNDSSAKVCQALMKGKTWIDLRKVIPFNEKGELTYYYLNQDRISYQGRLWVVDPKDGDFVSVFPGVYGIEFTNRDNITETVYHNDVF